MHEWPEGLRGYVLHIMGHPSPRVILWGRNLTLIYNEACIPFFGRKHPDCLGKPAAQPWAEMWDELGPLMEASYQGKLNKLERTPLMSSRNGCLEETYWDFTFLPIPGAQEDVIGLFLELTETTKLVLGERRQASIMTLSRRIGSADSLETLWSCYLSALEGAVEDVPYAFLYALEDDTSDAISESSSNEQTSKKCILRGAVGVGNDKSAVPNTFKLRVLDEADADFVKPFLQAKETRSAITLNHQDGTLPKGLPATVTGRAFGEEISKAIISPITSRTGSEILGFVLVGISPCAPLDEEYKLYTHFLADILIKAAALISLPQEQRRAQKLADEMNMALSQQLHLTTLRVERMEAKFSRMAAAAPTGMFVFDPQGHPFHVNQAFLEIFCETREEHAARESTTMAWTEHIHSDDLQRFHDAWQRLLDQKVPVTIEHRLKKPWTSIDKTTGQGTSGTRWLLANAFPDVDSDGKITAVMGWLTDISHRKFAENLLSRRLEDALENKRQTENFIDMTTHEMRNPLSAILQSADSISSTLNSAEIMDLKQTIHLTHETSDEIIDAVQTIILCAQHQKRIIDDILTLSKLDASLLVISPDKVQPPALLEKALRMFHAEIARAGITARVEIEPTYDELNVDWVVLDPSRLLQVIINLLTNAIKFTQYSDKRNITIYLGASFDRPTGKHHKVSFIPTKHVRPANSPLSAWGDGEDLFLQIAVADTGRGLSEDEMKVLFQRFSQASPKTYSQYGGSGLGLFISRELCELQGGQIGVSSGNDKTMFTFFVRAKRSVTDVKTHRPSMPRFTSAAASPVAFSRKGSFAVLDVGSGAEQQLVRVPSVAEEGESPKDFATDVAERLSRVSTSARDDEEKLHVLVVEDNLINQKVMSQQLRRAGCTVHVANHGLECLAFLERSIFCAAETPLSLILLDLEMPTMDGLTCIKVIRERQLNGRIVGHVPVIAVTANARSSQISKAIDAGMDQVVTKPFRIPELLPQMRGLLAEVAHRNEYG